MHRKWAVVVACFAFLAGAVPQQESGTGSVSAATAAASDDYPTIHLKKQCGAVGDGATNDTAAFEKAAELLQKAGGGTLVIPKATYVVGIQTHVEGQTPYYRSRPVFTVDELKLLVIEGNGATVRTAPGLRFGSIDPKTGEAYRPAKMPFLDRDYAVHSVNMFDITDSQHVTIRNLELDGNLAEFILGGEWGDTGRQLRGSGLRLYGNTDVQISRVNSHHHPLDGAMIGWSRLKESDPATPHTVSDCSFEYNGRQGLSWVGGRGMKLIRCKMNHTGRAVVHDSPFFSAPSAGLDIEAEDSICRDGHFEECEFVNNHSCGLVSDSGDGGYSHFERCTFWGVTSWSAWVKKPGMKFTECNFYGSVVHAVGSADANLATQFTRCHFEDKPWTNGLAYRRNSGACLVEIESGDLSNITFDGCTFTANTCRSIWFSGRGGMGFFSDCTFTHKKADLKSGEFQGLLRNCELRGCRFKEAFPEGTVSSWYIAADTTKIAPGTPTVVDGPCVRWRSPSGPVGIIAH